VSGSPIRIGTSGWSYPAGRGTWNGIFYPARAGRGQRRFDELSYYAEHFDTVEVNSSFYRPPGAAMAHRWVERTPPGFEFSLKLYQKFTHPEMFLDSTGRDPYDLGQADVDEFRRSLEPIATAGRLGALLAQFPVSFKNEPNTEEYLRWLLTAFRDYPIAVELRHRSWSDHAGRTMEILNEHGAAWAQIDEPKFRVSIRQTFRPNVPGLFYMRLHGRNAANWWTHERAEDRYDYLYSHDELKPFADTAKEIRKEVRKAYLYMNNHFAAKAVANAAMLKHQLGQPLPGGYPDEFVERYPALAGIVATASASLPLRRPS
jgi:uncharacterized protein YecE (DUF72 family)